jgi:hypothetical protein
MVSKRRKKPRVLHLITVFWLFQEKLKPARTPEKTPARDQANAFNRIRCPFCRWRPNGSSRWFCGDCDYPEYFYEGCGTAWNTFTTHGLCPGCNHQWRWTICLSCQRWSRHEEWYENQD